jgi:hypothetical protein
MAKAQKIQYSEDEAANMLGVSVDQLRSLVRDHIVKDATAPLDTFLPTYHPSDLVVLRILTGMSRGVETVACSVSFVRPVLTSG